MALIPGTLPNDTCYGTPQDLLELFAQYLDVPAFALSSKVVFSTTNTGFTSDIVWFDTTSATRPIMKITVSSSGFLDYIKNYITAAPLVTIVGADTLLIADASDSSNTKRGLVSDIVSLVPIVPANGSITYPMLNNGATESNNVAERTAKAWVNFDGFYAFTTGVPTALAIRSSFNISTITWTSGTNIYTCTFGSPLLNANYSVVATHSGLMTSTAITQTGDRVIYSNGLNNTTALFQLRILNSAGSDYQSRHIYAVVFGE
jgi:hypothetical protein